MSFNTHSIHRNSCKLNVLDTQWCHWVLLDRFWNFFFLPKKQSGAHMCRPRDTYWNSCMLESNPFFFMKIKDTKKELLACFFNWNTNLGSKAHKPYWGDTQPDLHEEHTLMEFENKMLRTITYICIQTCSQRHVNAILMVLQMSILMHAAWPSERRTDIASIATY